MQYIKILEELASPRLKTYLTPLGYEQTKDSTKAYFLLNDISQHFYVPLQLIEIALRNKIHQHISQKLRRQNWYDTLPVTIKSQAMVVEAKRLAREEITTRPVNHDDIVSRLTFGFWAYMLDKPYRNTADPNRLVWTDRDFLTVFSGKPRGITISLVMQRLQNLNDLRNRVFHHEPIWNTLKVNSTEDAIRVLKSKYSDMLEVLSWMSPDLYGLIHAWSFHGRFKLACDATRFDRDLW